jgi:hypothetical protein
MSFAKGAAVFLLVASLLSSGAEPDSKALGQCPYGHKTLKDIPILYGLPPFGGPELKEYNEKIAAGEFVSGSDNVFPDSPRIQVTCTTCGFEHTQNSRESGTWSRWSIDPKTYNPPLTKLLTGFPTASAKKLRRLLYVQNMDDQLHPFAELMFYHSAESLETVAARIDAWVKRRHLAVKRTTTHTKASERPQGYGAQDSIRWEHDPWGKDQITIDVSFSHRNGRCAVDLSHSWRP